MHRMLLTGAAAVALLAGLGAAFAQQPPPSPPNSAPQTTGNAAPSPPPQNSAAFVNGMLVEPGVSRDGPTVPSKVSQRNAALDGLPIMAQPLALTDAQKQQIVGSVRDAKPQAVAVALKPSDLLPYGVALHAFPQQVQQQVPAVAGLQFVKLGDKILLVRAPNRIVVAEIGK